MLKSLLIQQLSEKSLGGRDAKELTLLPNDVMTALKKNIRTGAEDQGQGWANALELVQKAYEIEGVARPEPSMKDAWKQYEENLQYAVQQLAKNRGMDGDWRMSSAMFRESMIPTKKFNVTIDNDEYVTEGRDVFEVIDTLTETVTDHETTIYKQGDGAYRLAFKKFKVKSNTSVTIQSIT